MDATVYKAGQWEGATGVGARLAHRLGEVRALLRSAAPMIAAGMLNMGLSLTDTAMMGWLDPRALASGVVVSDTYSILFYFAAGFVTAVAPLAAGAVGSGDCRKAGRMVGQGLWLLVPLALVGFYFIANSVSLMEGVGVALPLPEAGRGYAQMMGGAFAFMLLFAWARNALAALGRPRVPMYVLAAVLPLNALGNYVLMYGIAGFPEMGLAGAGASSLIVAVFAGTSLTAYLLSPAMRRFAVGSGLVVVRPRVLVRLLSVGLMTGLASLAETGVFLSSTIVMGLVAGEALAAHAVVFRMLALGYVIIVGLGQSVTIRVATAAGAGDTQDLRQARQTVQAFALGAVAVTLAVFSGAAQLAPLLARSGSADAMVLAREAAILLPLAGAALAALVLANLSAAFLRGRTDVRVPALLAVCGYWGVGFGTMYLLSGLAGLGAAGVWMGLAAGSAATALASWLYMSRREACAALRPA